MSRYPRRLGSKRVEDDIGYMEGLQMDIELSDSTPIQRNYVSIVVEQKGNGMPVYEVRPESGAKPSRVLHRNLLLPCTYLPVGKSNLPVSQTSLSGRRQRKRMHVPKDKQFAQDSFTASHDEDNSIEDIPSLVPSQLQPCVRPGNSAHPSEELRVNQDSPVIGNNYHCEQEHVSETSNDDAPTESGHMTFEAANESEQASVLETNQSEERPPQRLRRGPVRLTYDVPGQPVYYPAVTTNIHSVSGSTYPAPVSFGLTSPYLPSCHWPQYGLPIQPMYYFCA